jgi:hypothetical protein
MLCLPGKADHFDLILQRFVIEITHFPLWVKSQQTLREMSLMAHAAPRKELRSWLYSPHNKRLHGKPERWRRTCIA